MPRHITEYTLYRWRYSIGYALVGLLVAAILIAAVFYVPGGLRSEEIDSVIRSNGFSFTNFTPSSAINLPYTVLQYLSFTLLGITTFSIKLPSLLLALLALVGIILLLRQWFHMNVAVISALIMITTSHFIFSSQDGTPTILYIFLPTWILFLALKVSRKKDQRNFWEALLVGAIALSLYTPLSIYIIIALVSATLLHPHLRFIAGSLSRRKVLAACCIGLVMLAPLIMAVIMSPEVGMTLLGIPKEWPDLSKNILSLVETHLGFLISTDKPQSQSIYTLPSILLILLGIYYLFKTKHTARSYIIAIWLILLAPVILLNPGKTAITFTPVLLLITAGIDELLHTWYNLFPRNPYARVAGLLPITLLVVGMALTGIERYFYSYRYTPEMADMFSDDLRILTKELSTVENKPVALVTTKAELPFYEAVAEHTKAIEIVPPGQELPTDKSFIITREAFSERGIKDREPSRIITNGKASQSDRLYLYKSVEK